MRKIYFLIIFVFLMFSCEKKQEIVPETVKSYNISGKVEKGPFIKGTQITIHELDQKFIPTGKTFSTVIVENNGSFELKGIELISPYITLIAEGYFYNEISGDLSKGQITLFGIADLIDKSTINVNIITHLTRDRIFTLMEEEEMSLRNAQEKAQMELLSIFGLQNNNTKTFSDVSITDGTNESATQLIISSILLHNRSEAQFVEFVADLANSFKVEGTFPNEIKEQLWNTSVNLDIEYITQKLVDRYEELNQEIDILDLAYFIDWNKDGIAGNELGDIGEEKVLKFETDTLQVSKKGGEFVIKIDSNIPFIDDFSDQGNTHLEYIDPLAEIFTPLQILSKSYTDNTLTLTISPANGAFISDSTLTIYSYNGKYKASIVITQEGDMDKIAENEKLNELLDIIINASSITSDNNFVAEALYTHDVATSQDSPWAEFYHNQIFPYSFNIRKLWAQNYKAINVLNSFIGFEKLPVRLKSQCLTLRSIIYYQMVVLWGNIVYIERTSDYPTLFFTQTAEDDAYKKILINLEQSKKELFPIKNTDLQPLPISTHITDGLMAKILMHEEKYQDALSLINNIINSDLYSLPSSNFGAFVKENPDLIYSLPLFEESAFEEFYPSAQVLPVLRYTEILLMASECFFHLGKADESLRYLNLVEINSGKILSSTATLAELEAIWRHELSGNFSYFDFLKRNNLAEEKLSITSYKKLFPIPDKELQMNPNIMQNPGY